MTHTAPNKRFLSLAFGMALLLLSFTIAYAIDVAFEFDACSGTGTQTVTSSATGSNYDIQVAMSGSGTLTCSADVYMETDAAVHTSDINQATQLTFSLVGGASFTLNSISVGCWDCEEVLVIAPNGNAGLAENISVRESYSNGIKTFTPSSPANFTGITSFVITPFSNPTIIDGHIHSVVMPFSPTAVQVERFEPMTGANGIWIDMLLAGLCAAGLGALAAARRKWTRALDGSR